MKANIIHVIPVGGEEPIHSCNKDCWCYPLYSDEGEDGIVATHNAKDLREVRERRGDLNPETQWVLVREFGIPYISK